ncbi:nucleoside triphosphate pyrophosphohydrolase [Kordiimonas pumila]|uniref:Nucleoside triphosphate pyrophosphohydrolase n=1 Tax=Kordiimonas pumila TaxID=2161677 RepID=A0ABV7D2D3_9PROT|nr:nucleoside triphosphate pyrophosphohydrolase [Kordiimonas pumila]
MTLNSLNKKYDIQDLLKIMAQLRSPDEGCPWDIEQTFETIAPYTIEEAYEVDDAIRKKDMPALNDELGDLLLQVVFHSQIAAEKNLFNFDNVVSAICDKMIRRHPHVFADAHYRSAEEQTSAWEAQKAVERSTKADHVPSALDGVPTNLPALLRAFKLQKRAARVGFDWPETIQVLDKIQEESIELVEEYQKGTNRAALKEEFGDLLFVMANLGRHMKLDPEECLRSANIKFERRFKEVESKLQEKGIKPENSNLAEMDALWNIVKAEEKQDVIAEN